MAFSAPRIDLTFGVDSVFEMNEFKLLAKLADAVAGVLLEKLAPGRGKAMLEQFGGISQAIENVVGTKATAWFSMTSTTGMFKAGVASMLPRERH